jgi:hypothetical protein
MPHGGDDEIVPALLANGLSAISRIAQVRLQRLADDLSGIEVVAALASRRLRSALADTLADPLT